MVVDGRRIKHHRKGNYIRVSETEYGNERLGQTVVLQAEQIFIYRNTHMNLKRVSMKETKDERLGNNNIHCEKNMNAGG